MHPTLGSLVWSKARGPLLRAQMIVAFISVLLLAMTLPSCAWFNRTSSPSGASAGVPALLDAEPEIRVRLASKVAAVGIDGPGVVWVGREGGLAPGGRVPLPLVISMDDDSWWILLPSGDRELLAWPNNGRFAAEIRRVDDQPLHVHPDTAETANAETSWEIAGRLVLTLRDDEAGSFDVVEHVGTEVYLAGVLAAELPWDWSIEAMKAQAVAARTYALQERQRRLGNGLHFDVESDTRSQAYSGLRTHPRAVQAVRETGGLVLMEGNALVRAYYSSTCGGRQQLARNIWPTRSEWAINLGPAINAGVTCTDCAASPRYRWTAQRSRAALREALREYGKKNGFSIANLGTIKSIEATARTDQGRPTVFTITDESNKAYTLSAEHFRQAANTGLTSEQLRKQRVSSSDLEVKITGEQITITGQGFGHGVGLCQYGSQGKATRGMSWQRILRDYYPTAQVVPFYGKPTDRPGFVADRTLVQGSTHDPR